MTNEVKIEEAEIWVLEHSLKQNQLKLGHIFLKLCQKAGKT